MENEKFFMVGEILTNSVENLYKKFVRNNVVLDGHTSNWSEICDKERYLTNHDAEDMHETIYNLVGEIIDLRHEIGRIIDYIEFVRRNKEVI